MTVNTPGGSLWPARLAYVAAAIFSLASGLTNITYGWSKGADTASSVVWAAVSIGVSIVFAASWPALIRSIDTKQWTRAAMAFVALLLTGTYSVSAALGSAMGGRASAALEEKDAGDRKVRAQAAYDTAQAELTTLTTAKPATELQTLIDSAKAELAKLPPTRNVAEIDALIRGAAMNPRASHGCTAMNGSLRMSCPKLEGEKARAAQRDRLTTSIATWTKEIGEADQRRAEQREKTKAAMDKAAAELAKTGPAKQIANSDAKALATYLSKLGFDVDAERVNGWLVLLAVLVIECGGGLSLAVGMALGDRTAASPDFAKASAKGASGATATREGNSPLLHSENAGQNPSPKPRRSARDGLLEMLAGAKGPLRVGQEGLAEALGVTSARVRQLLNGLAATGAIRVRTSSAGTTITLIDGGRA